MDVWLLTDLISLVLTVMCAVVMFVVRMFMSMVVVVLIVRVNVFFSVDVRLVVSYMCWVGFIVVMMAMVAVGEYAARKQQNRRTNLH